MVSEFAYLVEETLQSYGQTILCDGRGDALRAVELHLAGREKARKCLHAILQSSAMDKCVETALGHLDCLYTSIDTVMTAMSIQCPALVSNVRV
jgi:hypothetical protein